MKFEHLFSPMQVGKVTYRNRIVSAPMAFGLIVQNPDARDFTYRKLEASAKGGNGCVIVGETDVNFTDAVRIPGFRPFDFAKPEEDPETFDAVGEYARRIKRHGAVALAELVHCGKEKVPFGPGQEAIGPIETTNLAGVRVRPMNEDDMARIARDFAVSATYMQKAGFDGVLIHGGHGFLFTQFLSPLMNTRTDSYGGSLENRARFPLQILKAVREAVGPDFLVELRIDGTDHQPGGITPEETGAFVAMAEPYITSVHVTCGIYEASVKSGTESSMFHPHGLNIDNAAIIKKYTKLPVGAVGGINSPELCEQAIAEGKIDFADKSVTENTRVSYPIDHIQNIVRPISSAPAAKNVIFLSADAFGVLPPVSILTPEQTQYYFLSGFTAKLAGTERGITEPTPTFSACFGQAFLELHPTKYAEELVKKMKASGAKAYLVNTGWNGTGKRISIKDTRGIIDAILSGAINEAPTKKIPYFDFEVPTALPGVDPAILDPRDTYADAAQWEEKAKDLAGRFIKNFAKYEGNEHGKALVSAGPQL